MEEETEAINAEIRFLTLELMKISIKEKKEFKKVASEFISNAHILARMIRKKSIQKARRMIKEATATSR